MEFEVIALPDGKKILAYVWKGRIVCWKPLEGFENTSPMNLILRAYEIVDYTDFHLALEE